MVATGAMEIGIGDELAGVAPEVKDRLAAYFADVAFPTDVAFATKPAIGGDLVARAASWKIRRAPVLGDQGNRVPSTTRSAPSSRR